MRAVRVLSAVAAGAVLASTLLACAQEPERSAAKPSSVAPTESSPSPSAKPTTPAFDRAAHSIDDPQSIWVVSNKRRALKPVDFAPNDLAMPEGVENEFAQPLRAPAATAVVRLIRRAEQAGLKVRIISAYRDYATQVTLYDRYVERDGKQQADTYSARPGHSEHQTGLAVDLDDFGDCYLAACFGQTPSGTWIAAHAAEYGFVIRYPEGKQGITGFMPEPWHLRYVGPELAAEMKRTGVATLEEFFGLPAAPDYAKP